LVVSRGIGNESVSSVVDPRGGTNSQGNSEVVGSKSSVRSRGVPDLVSVREGRVFSRSSFSRFNSVLSSREGSLASKVPGLVSAVVTRSVFWALNNIDGGVTHDVVSRGRGVEVKVEPSLWWVEADEVNFVDTSSVGGVRVVAQVVRRSTRNVWVSVDVSGPVSVVDVDFDLGGSFWDPDSEVVFSHLSVPVGSVWGGDVSDSSARWSRSNIDSDLTSGGAGGLGGQDGVSAKTGVIRRWDITADGDVKVRTWLNVGGFEVRSREKVNGIRRSISEVISDTISAWEVSI